jgi:hypothetical protein
LPGLDPGIHQKRKKPGESLAFFTSQLVGRISLA